MLLVLTLTLCGCASQTEQNKEGATVQTGASSEVQKESTAAAGTAQDAADGTTIASIQSGGEAAGVPFGYSDDESSTKGSKTDSTTDGNTDNTATTENTATTKGGGNGNKEKTTKKGGDKKDSSGDISLPRIPIPQK